MEKMVYEKERKSKIRARTWANIIQLEWQTVDLGAGEDLKIAGSHGLHYAILL